MYTEIKRKEVDPMIKRKVCNGYTTVTMTYDRALREMPYAQCGVNIHADGTIVFISYTTPVISISPDGWLSCTGTYSPTTRKQIGRFLREYAPLLTYQHAKAAYILDTRINIYTAETENP